MKNGVRNRQGRLSARSNTRRRAGGSRSGLAQVVALTAVAVLFGFASPATAATGVSCGRAGLETVATDKADYPPGATVHVSGAGFSAACDVVINISRPDGVVETADVVTDLGGSFSYDYVLPPPPGVIGLYTVDALGLGGETLASMSFTDAPPVNDPPTASAPASVSTSEDTPTNVTVSGSDVETGAADLGFMVTAAPLHGMLKHGSTVLTTGSTFTATASAATFVGKWGSFGSGDGQFQQIEAVATESDGSVYVADAGNSRIQKFTADGAFVTTWGSFGSGNGQFQAPGGVAVAPDGSVYVVDRSNHWIQRFTAGGSFVSKWGSFGSGNGQFQDPASVAVGPDGSVYVADYGNRRIQRFTAAGGFLGKWGTGPGFGDGQFQAPSGVAVGPDGSVYVADTGHHRIQRFTAGGVFMSKWGSPGTGDGQFLTPSVAVGPDGSVYVATRIDNRIQKFTAGGGFLGKWGSFGSGDGQFDAPIGVAVARDGSVYVADQDNHRIQRFAGGSAAATLTYAPAGDYNGPDSFAFKVTDRGDPDNCGAPSETCAAAKSDEKNVSIIVNAMNDAPVAADDHFVGIEDADKTMTKASLLANDSDAADFIAAAADAGAYHTCAVRADATLMCWGQNAYGQSTPPAGTFASASAGFYHSCGVRTDGSVACWGWNAYGQTSAPAGSFKSVSAGYAHTCAVKNDDTLLCWGGYGYGTNPPAGTFSAVGAGNDFSCGIRTDGSLACWGYSGTGMTNGALGTFRSLSVGLWHSCAIRTDNSMACWGENPNGKATAPAGTFRSVGTGGGSSCGVKTDGTLTCWGSAPVPPAGTFGTITLGYVHYCALKTDGHLTCWGDNSAGQTNIPVNESLSLTAVSNAIGGTVEISGSNVIFHPASNVCGNNSASFDYTVSDGGLSDTGTVTLDLTCVNDEPALDVIADQSVNEDAAEQTVALTGIGSGAANESQTLTVTATSSNTSLVPHPSVVYTSPNATGSLRYTPAADKYGTALITATVRDNGGTANGGGDTKTRSFQVTVSPGNDTPTAFGPASVSTNEDSAVGVSVSGSDSETPANNLTFTITQAPAHGALAHSSTALVAGSTFAGSAGVAFSGKWGTAGGGDGQFSSPQGIAIGPDGSVYVAEFNNNRIQKFSSNGAFLAKWGASGSSPGQFSGPRGVAVAPDGSVYVVDSGNQRIQKFTASGSFVTQWGGVFGPGDGQFGSPLGVSVAADGNVYVADFFNDRVQKFTSNGTFVAKWGTSGPGDGQFNRPLGIAVAPDGSVYVTDLNYRVQRFTANGAFLGKWGSSGSGDGQFNYPRDVAVDPAGNVFVADFHNSRVQKFTATGTFLTKWGSTGSGDGQFNQPQGVATTSTGAVYTSDGSNHRVQRFDDLSALTYTPAADHNGPDSFKFKVTDRGDPDNCGAPSASCDQVKTDEKTVALTVKPVNDAPVASDGNASLDEDGSKAVDLSALTSDVETADANLAYAIVSGPSKGMLSGSGQTRTYTPNANYNGSDSFTYKVTDRGDPDNCAGLPPACSAALASSTKTVSITVNPVNDVPVASAGGPYSGNEGSVIQLDGSGSSDPEAADTLTYAWTAPAACSLSSATAQKPTITCNDSGNYAISLRVTDNSGAASTASSSVAVNNVAPAVPNLLSPSTNTASNAPTFDWSDSTDPAGANDTVTYTIEFTTGAPASSFLVVNGLTSSGFTPTAAQLPDGTYAWKVSASDEDGGTSAYSSTRSIDVDRIRPTGALNINGGATYTDSTSVTLNLSGTDERTALASYRVAEGMDCSGATFEPASGGTTYSADVPFTLSSGDGTKTVCAQYKDSAGNLSTTATASIILDQTKPSISVAHTADGSSGWNTSSPVSVSVTASDSGSGLSGAPNCTVDGSSAPVSGTGPYTLSVSGEGTHAVSCSISDNGGNSNTATDSVKIDTADPAVSVTHRPNGANGWNTASPVNVSVATVDPQYATEVLADNPSGYWRLGEASGASAADASGHGRTGSYAGSPTLGVAGAVRGNTAATFNGTSQYVSIADFDITAQIAVEAWVKPAVGGQGGKIVAKHSDATNVQGTLGLGAGRPTWEITTGGSYHAIGGSSVLPTTSWTHLVGTYDGSTATLYVNGVAAVSKPASGPIATNNFTWRIASLGCCTTGLLNGAVDEAAVYDHALTPSRVLAHYLSSTSSGPASGLTGPPTCTVGGSPAAVTGSSSPYSISVSGDGTHHVSCSVSDNAGNSGTANDTVKIDSIDPTGSLTIDGDAAYTNSRLVTLNLSAADATSRIVSYRVANGTVCSSASFVTSFTAVSPYSSNVSFTLSSADGSKTVCAQFKDDAGNVSATATDAITLDTNPPTVTSVARADADPTNATAVRWTVRFSESVNGVGTADFALATTGVSDASITGVSGSGDTYTVTANTGTGNGTIGLNLADDDSIRDVAGNVLGGTGTGNGDFTGQVYTVQKNQQPAATTPSFAPASPRTNDSVSASTATTDPDGDNVSVAWVWKVTRGSNTCTVKTESSAAAAVGQRTSSLDLSQSYSTSNCSGASAPSSLNPSKGDVLTVETTPHDGMVNGATQSNDVTISNSAPTATVALNPGDPRTNDTLTATATASDDDGDQVTLTYVWKVNGTVVQTTAGSSSLTDTLDLSVAGNGDKGDTVTVEVTPNDGVVDGATKSASATVANTPPMANAGGPYSGDEGSAIHLDGSGSLDPDAGDTPTYSWSAPAACTLSSATAQKPNVTCNDNGNYTVSLTVTDNSGATSALATATVTASNVAPAVTLSSPAGGAEGGLIAFSYSWTDPGSGDTFPAAGSTVDCGPKGIASDKVFTPATKTGSFKCTFTDDSGAGTFAVAATVTDDDGGAGSDAEQIKINNVTPVVTLSGSLSANEGDTKSYSYSWVDPGSGDTFPAAGNSVDCGPKATVSEAVFTPASKTGSFKCRFIDDSGAGTFAVKATVTDDDGGVGSDTKQVDVENVAPTATFNAPDSLAEGSTIELSLTNPSDPSTQLYYPRGPQANVPRNALTGWRMCWRSTYAESMGPANYIPTILSQCGGNYLLLASGPVGSPTFDVAAAAPRADVVHDTGANANVTHVANGVAWYFNTSWSWGFAPEGETVSKSSCDTDGGWTKPSASPTLRLCWHTFSNYVGYGWRSGANIDLNGSSAFERMIFVPNGAVPGDNDPGGSDTAAGFTYAFDCGTGSGYSTPTSSNTASCPTTDNGSRTVKGKIIDQDGGFTEYTEGVIVNNVAPTASFPTTRTVDEGSSSSFAFTGASDPSSADTNAGFHYAYSCTGASLAGATYASSGTAASVDCSFPDGPANETVRARIIDKDGGFTEYSTAVTVENVAPTLVFTSAPASANEGQTKTYAYSITDPGADGVTSVTTSCGANGAKSNASNTNSGGSFDCTFPDGLASSAVSAQATDTDGGAGNTASQGVSVANVAPTVSLSGPPNVNEGTTHTYSFAVTDPGQDTFTVATGYPSCGTGGNVVDGSLSTNASGGTFDCSFPDGPATTNVAIKVVDSDGASDSDSEAVQIVQVANVAPTLTAAANQSSDEGESHSFQLGSFTDPGPDGPWAVSVDWGDGSPATSFAVTTTGSLGTKPHMYADGPDMHTVTVTVTDENNGSESKSFDVTVANVNPTVVLSGPAAADEGQTKSYSFSASDPGDEVFALVSASCGLGNSRSSLAFNPATGTGSFECTFPDGPDTVSPSVSVSDGDGGAGSDSRPVTVQNVAPPTPTLASPADGAETNDNTPSFDWSDVTDQGVDAVTYALQANEGGCEFSGVLEVDASGVNQSEFTPASGLADGTFCWRVRSTDEDGASSAYSGTHTVTVDTVKPNSVITFPADGGTYNNAGWDDGCGSAAGDICGTASDASPSSGLAKVELSIKQLSSGMYWDGDGFDSGTEVFAVASGTGHWSYNFSPPTDGRYTIRSRTTDDAGNVETSLDTATFNEVHFARDTVAPDVSIDEADAQLDPTNSSPIHFTAVFSEPVSGFDSGDVTIAGTAGGTKTVTVTGSGEGKTYDVAVSGMSDGTVVASIDAGKATDAGGNANTSSTSTDNSVRYDITRPDVAIDQAATQVDPTQTQPVHFTAVFSEPVSGFDGGDVTIGGSAGGTKTVSVTGSGDGKTYDVAVSGLTDGTVIASIAADRAHDAAGNANTASTSTDNTVVYDPDSDSDGVVNSRDNCVSTANPAQENNDGDAQGDACDPDDDNDTVADTGDNCQFTSNPGQQNNDGDAQGDACDADDDNDTVVDGTDNCQFAANLDQADIDQDGRGDACDPTFTSTPCKVSGVGRISSSKSFSFTVEYFATGTFSGSLTYTDSAVARSFRTTTITGLACYGTKRATMIGTGKVNNTTNVNFRVDIGDFGSGRTDTFTIRWWSPTYTATGTLTSGDIIITKK